MVAPRREPRSRSRMRRAAPILGAMAFLFGVVAVVAATPIAPGSVSGSFSLGPNALPAGTLGGSALNVSQGGTSAVLTIWTTPDVRSYFLDVLSFTLTVDRAVDVQVGVGIVSSLASTPAGSEIYAVVGTPASTGPAGGNLSFSTPVIPGGVLSGVQGIGGPEGAYPGLLYGLDVSPTGQTFFGGNPTADVAFSSPGSYTLVLTLGVLLPANDTSAFSTAAFTISISLSHSL